MVYISDLSWTKKVKHPSEILTVGDTIDVIVMELDVEGRKLSLGHKQTQENPWDKYAKEFSEGTIHNVQLTEIVDKGAIISFNENITAFVPSRHMEKEDGSRLGLNEKVKFKIIEFNKDFKRVVASHTSTFKNDERKTIIKNKIQNSSDTNEKATLGDLDALADLKEKMDKK